MCVATEYSTQTASRFKTDLRNEVHANAHQNNSSVDLYGTPVVNGRRSPYSSETANTYARCTDTVRPAMQQQSTNSTVSSSSVAPNVARKIWSINSLTGPICLVSFPGLLAFVMYFCFHGASAVTNRSPSGFQGSTFQQSRSQELRDTTPGLAVINAHPVAEKIVQRLDQSFENRQPLMSASEIAGYSYNSGRYAALGELRLQENRIQTTSISELEDFAAVDLKNVFTEALTDDILKDLIGTAENPMLINALFQRALRNEPIDLKEIAEELGVSERTVRRQLEQIRKAARLRGILGTHLVVPAQTMRQYCHTWHNMQKSLSA